MSIPKHTGAGAKPSSRMSCLSRFQHIQSREPIHSSPCGHVSRFSRRSHFTDSGVPALFHFVCFRPASSDDGGMLFATTAIGHCIHTRTKPGLERIALRAELIEK